MLVAVISYLAGGGKVPQAICAGGGKLPTVSQALRWCRRSAERVGSVAVV